MPAMYAQGIQGRDLEGEGMMSAALGRWRKAMLHMEDNTLALEAQSKVGLQSRTEKYN